MRSDAVLNVLVFHRDPLMSFGLLAALRDDPDLRVSCLEQGNVDRRDTWMLDSEGVLVVDYERGLELLTAARRGTAARQGQVPRLVLVTCRDSEWEIQRALETGARGYLTLGCSVDELKAAVHAVHQGLRYVGAQAAQRLADAVASEGLTARETEVLRWVVEGHTNKTIAGLLGITVGTIKAHLKVIFQKLGARNRTEVAAVAGKRGLLRLPETRVKRTRTHPNGIDPSPSEPICQRSPQIDLVRGAAKV